MTTLAAGVLLKLLDGMKSGAAKPVGEHRTAVLQVTDIVPADLDEKDLWPRHGFYVKVSDSSHSIYASLALGQDDLVLSNKLQLGQFVHVDRFDPGSPVPVIVGARPLPGRHPLVGTPEPIVRSKVAGHRRGSWGPEHNHAGVLASPKVVKPTVLNFDDKTPVKERVLSSPAASSASVRKSRSILSKFTRSKSVAAEKDHPKIPKSPFPIEKSSVSCATSQVMRRCVREEDSSPPSSDELGSSATSSKKSSKAASRVPVPSKLNLLGKEAIEQREQAQKAALEALRNASAIENVVRIYKMFSELSRTARPDAPAACFDKFLSFHQEAVQAVTDVEAVQAATLMAAAAVASREAEDAPTTVLQEIAQNTSSKFSRSTSKRGLAVSKSVSFALDTADSKPDDGGAKHRSSNTNKNGQQQDRDEKKASSNSTLGCSLRLAKQIQTEAGNWFMDFLEAALESGLKKSRGSSVAAAGDGRKQSSCCCPQSLILRVINWVEMEQSGSSSKKPAHARAAQIARKLRIKAKNP